MWMDLPKCNSLLGFPFVIGRISTPHKNLSTSKSISLQFLPRGRESNAERSIMLMLEYEICQFLGLEKKGSSFASKMSSRSCEAGKFGL
jgi:hypothetical protein